MDLVSSRRGPRRATRRYQREGRRQGAVVSSRPVRKVEAVSSQDIEQFKKIVVDPAMNPQDLEEVRVIVDWAGGEG